MKNIFYTILITAIVFASSCSKDNNTFAGGNANTSTAGSLARFVIAGNYLYTIDNKNLSVFDITNATTPVLKNTVIVDGGIETIFPFKNKLFIGSASKMYVYNITTPTNPFREAEAQHITKCDPVIANDTVAYLTLHSGTNCRNGSAQSELQIYNTKNSIVNPQFIGSIPMGNPLGLGIKDTTLFVCNQEKGLAVFNIKKGYVPILKQSYGGEIFMDVIPYNNTLTCMLKDGIAYYDITDVNNMVKLSVIKN
jgi:LVIVD repeat